MIMGAWGMGSGGGGGIPSAYRIGKAIASLSSANPVSFGTGVYNSSEWSASVFSHCDGLFNNRYDVIGAYVSTSWTGFGVMFCGNPIRPRIVHGTSVGIVDWNRTGDLPFSISVSPSSTVLTFNGSSKSVSSSSALNDAEIRLFAFGNSATTGELSIGETVINQGGTEVAHLYPVLRVADNVPCFYDVVQKCERINLLSGTVSFVEL